MSISICVWWLCGEPGILGDMFLYNMQSCANNLAVESGDVYFGRSLINRRQSRGWEWGNTLPCGTPDWTETEVDVAPSSRNRPAIKLLGASISLRSTNPRPLFCLASADT